MLDLLKNQQNTSKIPEGLGVDVPTANKTGETDEDQHDIAIVYGTKTTYILCVMSENASNAIANIRNISRVVYNYLNLQLLCTMAFVDFFRKIMYNNRL